VVLGPAESVVFGSAAPGSAVLGPAESVVFGSAAPGSAEAAAWGYRTGSMVKLLALLGVGRTVLLGSSRGVVLAAKGLSELTGAMLGEAMSAGLAGAVRMFGLAPGVPWWP
jgi:hypothetical protein